MSDKTFNDEIRSAVNSAKLIAGMSAHYVRLPASDFRAIHRAASIYVAEEDARAIGNVPKIPSGET